MMTGTNGQRFSLRDFLKSGSVTTELPTSSKKEILQALADFAAAQCGQEGHVIFDVLWAREKLGTTGVGGGIAIPHGRVPGQSKVQGFFAQLKEPVAFESVDNRPVDLVFLLLSPEEAGADHLHALAIVSRLLRDAALCDKLRNAKDETSIFQLLTDAAEAEIAA